MTLRVTYDDTSLIVHLEAMSRRVHDELKRTIAVTATELADYVKNQKLSGQVLNERTGALKASINSSVEDQGSRITGKVFSDGSVPYARIHEYGGVITPKVANFLHFIIDGKEFFVKHVAMPERSFMRSSLEENRAKIVADLDAAVRRAVSE